MANALYYPYIHFRDDSWVKAAALYWDGLARIVPPGYPTRDSSVVQELRDQLDFIIDVDPRSAARDVAPTFIDFLTQYEDPLRALLARTGAGQAASSEFAGVAQISGAKVDRLLRDALESAGVAHLAGRSEGRSRDHTGSWLAMDPRLAAVYMCVLTSSIAHRSGLSPTTDTAQMHAAAGSWSVGRIATTMFERSVTSGADMPPSADALQQRIAFLALDVPALEINDATVSEIVALRRGCGHEIWAFQATVAAASAELCSLPVDVDAAVLEHCIRDVVMAQFREPLRELDRALRGTRLKIGRSLLSMKVELPILGAGAAAHLMDVSAPSAFVAGGAVGVVTVALDARDDMRRRRSESPSASYLLSVDRALRPKSAVAKGLRYVKRAYGMD